MGKVFLCSDRLSRHISIHGRRRNNRPRAGVSVIQFGPYLERRRQAAGMPCCPAESRDPPSPEDVDEIVIRPQEDGTDRVEAEGLYLASPVRAIRALSDAIAYFSRLL